MSALGQKRTCAVSFDYLVGGSQQRWRHGEPERLCGFDIGWTSSNLVGGPLSYGPLCVPIVLWKRSLI